MQTQISYVRLTRQTVLQTYAALTQSKMDHTRLEVISLFFIHKRCPLFAMWLAVCDLCKKKQSFLKCCFTFPWTNVKTSSKGHCWYIFMIFCLVRWRQSHCQHHTGYSSQFVLKHEKMWFLLYYFCINMEINLLKIIIYTCSQITWVKKCCFPKLHGVIFLELLLTTPVKLLVNT